MLRLLKPPRSCRSPLYLRNYQAPKPTTKADFIQHYQQKLQHNKRPVNSLSNLCIFYGKTGKYIEALKAFDEMKLIAQPKIRDYNTVLFISGKTKDVKNGLAIFAEMKENKVAFSDTTYNILIQYHWLFKLDPFELYNEMKSKKFSTIRNAYRVLFSAAAAANNHPLAIQIFEEMRSKGIKADVFIYNRMIIFYAKKDNYLKSIQLLQETEKEGIRLNVFSYNAVITVLAHAHFYEKALQVYEEMMKSGVEPDAVTFTILILIYCRLGNTEEAEAILKGMQTPDELAYSTLMSAYRKKGEDFAKQAFKLFSDMVEKGIQPNEVIFTILIGLCGPIQKPDKAMKYLTKMRQSGLSPNVVTYNTLIRLFAGMKQSSICLSLFEHMKTTGRYFFSIFLFFSFFLIFFRNRSRYSNLDNINSNVHVSLRY